MDDRSALIFLLSLALLLGVSRLLGELARSIGLPLIVGELGAGVLLGPTVLGRVLPIESHWLFGEPRPQTMLSAYTTLAVVLLLVVAGLEVDLSVVRRRWRSALFTSTTGMLLPIAGGFALGMLLPDTDLVHPDRRLLFALFLGVALSISALPVIAKTLLDLGLFKTDLGLLVMTSAMLFDVAGWLGFSLLLGPVRGESVDLRGLGVTLGLMLGFLAFSLFVLRRAVDWLVGRIEQEQQAAPERVLSLVILLALLGAAATQALGIHAIFGGFVVGVTVGDSPRLKERTRVVMHQFVTNIFAPVFFASLGMRVDFVRSFDWRLSALLFLVATIAKVGGCTVGARASGLKWRESFAVGFGLNSRGAMEIILAIIALEAGLITERLLVALVVMALATSFMSGPILKRLLYRKHEEDVIALLRRGAFLPTLSATTPTEAIHELIDALAVDLGELAPAATSAVIERELAQPTGLGDEVAIPHAAVAGLARPLLALGRASGGIDFDAPDGRPAKIIFLLLMPPRAYEEEVRVLASIARSIFDARAREELLAAKGFDAVSRVRGANAKRIEEAQHAPRTASLVDL
jgi:Kef-type K+ transport system membrane component KefB/mannitol/fructose-specific phosphotransferase system IIA component